jgi:hypothetical protein
MIPKGHRDLDGFQRFSYPPLSKMLVKPTHAPVSKTLTIPPTLPVSETIAAGGKSKRGRRADRSKNVRWKAHPIKFWQPIPFKSPQWRACYGMRNLVESSNKLLKDDLTSDLENARKRSGRGYAATYFALAFAVVASNLTRIASFFVAEASRIEDSKKLHRTRRRKDELGKPLTTPTDTGPPVL